MEYFRKFKSYVLGEVSARSSWTVLVIGHEGLEKGVIVEQDLYLRLKIKLSHAHRTCQLRGLAHQGSLRLHLLLGHLHRVQLQQGRQPGSSQSCRTLA